MTMPLRPSVVYGATTLLFSLPCRPWSPKRKSNGGSRVYTAGTVTSYVRSRFATIALRVRFTEDEYAAVATMIDWLHDNSMGPATVRTDQDDAATAMTVYLQSPAPGDEWEPTRASDDPSVFEFDLVFRRTTATAISAEYYG